MKHISPSTKANIVSLLLHSDKSFAQIAASVGVGKTTVARVAKEVVPDKENLSGGRPKKLSATDEHAIVSQITTGRAENAVEVTQNINSIISEPVSTQTVRNVLKKSGMKACVKKKKPLLTTCQKKLRLEFALKHKEWTVEDWKRVIWSDESKINRFGSDGRNWIWKERGQPLIDREINETVKFGGGNIMVWGCMGWNGVGRLAEIEGRMDAKQLVEILEDHLLPSIEESGIPREDFIFQQDNDPKHKSKMAKQWFENQGITLLDWPPQSPDLNPIEHLWTYLKNQLKDNYEVAPKGVWELWERVAKEWEEIEPEECQRLIESMPRRLEAVIRAKGGHTKY